MRRLISQLGNRARGFFVPTGRHRGGRPLTPHPSTPARLRPLISPTVQAWYEPIDGTTTRLVRPYLTVYERDEEARLQRRRDDTLWSVTHRIDLNTRGIHAQLEAA